MSKLLLAIAATLVAGPALSATAVNSDTETRVLIVTEGGQQSQLTLAAGETLQFCSAGCFVTMPDGDRAVLSGTETLEISGGKGRIR